MKNRKLTWIVAALAIFAAVACQNPEDTIQSIQAESLEKGRTDAISETWADEVYGPLPITTWLGKGINPIGAHFVNGSEINRAQILNVSKLYNDSQIVQQERHKTGVDYWTSDSLVDINKSSNASLGISGGASNPFFSASASADYSFSETLSYHTENKYAKGSVSYVTMVEYLRDPSPTTLQQYLTSSFRQDCNTKSASYLLDIYGPYAIVRDLSGGRMDWYMTYFGSVLKTNKEVTAAFSSSIRGIIEGVTVSGGSSVTYGTSEQRAEFINNTLFHYFSVGGKNTAYLSLDALITDIAAWMESINAQGELCGIENINDLVPLWYLIPNPVKAQEVKDEFEARLAGISIPEKKVFEYGSENSVFTYNPSKPVRIEIYAEGASSGSGGGGDETEGDFNSGYGANGGGTLYASFTTDKPLSIDIHGGIPGNGTGYQWNDKYAVNGCEAGSNTVITINGLIKLVAEGGPGGYERRGGSGWAENLPAGWAFVYASGTAGMGEAHRRGNVTTYGGKSGVINGFGGTQAPQGGYGNRSLRPIDGQNGTPARIIIKINTVVN